MGWLRVGRVRDGVGDLGVLGASLIIISPPYPEFRENLQDLLPTMPKADDYFLLRWLRGEAGGIGGSQEKVWEALGTVHRVVKNRALESACFGLESRLPFKLVWDKNSVEPQFLPLQSGDGANSPQVIVSVKLEGVVPGIRWAQGRGEVRVNTWGALGMTGLTRL